MKINSMDDFKKLTIVDYPIISANLDRKALSFTIELEGSAIKNGNHIQYFGPGFLTFYDWEAFTFLRLEEGKLEVDLDLEAFDEITRREFEGNWLILGGYVMDDWCEYRINSPKVKGQFAEDDKGDPS